MSVLFYSHWKIYTETLVNHGTIPGILANKIQENSKSQGTLETVKCPHQERSTSVWSISYHQEENSKIHISSLRDEWILYWTAGTPFLQSYTYNAGTGGNNL